VRRGLTEGGYLQQEERLGEDLRIKKPLYKRGWIRGEGEEAKSGIGSGIDGKEDSSTASKRSLRRRLGQCNGSGRP